MTDAQKQALDFIRTSIAATGVSPSYDEIAIALGLKAKSGVYRVVHELIERGLLRQEGGPNRARNLVLIDAPSDFERGRRFERKLIAREAAGIGAATAKGVH